LAKFSGDGTYGYFKLKDGYASCSKGVCEKATPSGSCNAQNIGKLVMSGSDVALCLAEYDSTNPKSYPVLKFSSDTKPATAAERKYYFAQHKPKTPFSLDSSMNFYAVITYENYILYDNEMPASMFFFFFFFNFFYFFFFFFFFNIFYIFLLDENYYYF